MKNVWIWNHYAGNMFLDRDGRHYNFAKYMLEEGCVPTIFCAGTIHNSDKSIDVGDGIYKVENVDGIDFVFVKTPLYKGNGILRVINIVSFYWRVKQVAKQLYKQNNKPDVILASSVHPLTCVAGIQTARKLKVPCVVEIRDLWPEALLAVLHEVQGKNITRKNIFIKILYRLERWLYHNADRLIFTMAGGGEYIKDRGWVEIDQSKIYNVNNGVDLTLFDKNKTELVTDDSDLVNPDTFKVVYIGSIREANNVGIILESAKEIAKSNPNIMFLVYGDGTERVSLETRVAKENIVNVIFKGRVAKNYIPYILSKADLAFLNYPEVFLHKYGGSHNKLFEYFASGKPVLATIDEGYNLITYYNAGVSLNNPTPSDIAREIINFAAMPPEKLKEFGDNARRAAMDYDFKILTQKLLKILGETTI